MSERILKDAFSLWWDFLKLSDSYKKYCDAPPPWVKFAKLGYRFKVPNENKSNYMDYVLPGHITETYLTFGNVHTESFESFWETKGRYFKGKKVKPVRDMRDELSTWIDVYKKLCDAGYFDDKNQSVDGFKTFLFEKALFNRKALNDDFVYLSINMQCPLADIQNSFNKFVNLKKQKQKVGDKALNQKWISCRNWTPTPNLRVDEVRRYFDVLHAYKILGLKGRKAFEKARPSQDYDDPDEKRSFFLDKEKAEGIVKNVVIGYFPGRYEKKEIQVPISGFKSLDSIPSLKHLPPCPHTDRKK